MSGLNFIPNSLKMGLSEANFLLLTGPNMGGKSTTLRMVCVIAIIAQLGAFVPCKFMKFSLVDRIFTRLGASD
jgi:DNA mismatch repair protein MSH6